MVSACKMTYMPKMTYAGDLGVDTTGGLEGGEEEDGEGDGGGVGEEDVAGVG